MNPQASEFNTKTGRGKTGLMASKWAPEEQEEIEQYAGASLFRSIEEAGRTEPPHLRPYLITAENSFAISELLRLQRHTTNAHIELDTRLTRQQLDIMRVEAYTGQVLQLIQQRIAELDATTKAREESYQMFYRASRAMPPIEVPIFDQTAAQTVAPPNRAASTIGNACVETQAQTPAQRPVVPMDTPHESNNTPQSHVKPNSQGRINSSTQSHGRISSQGNIMSERLAAAYSAAEIEAAEALMSMSRSTVAHVKPKRWMPVTIRKMPKVEVLAYNNHETFTWEFLMETLKGQQISPSFHYNDGKSTFQCNAYWLLEGSLEPCAPESAGQHGAKLSVFFSSLDANGEELEEDIWMNVPVFSRPDSRANYTYLGNYSQTRFSDKVSYDHMMDHIPKHIREFWAEQLTVAGRPEWVTEKLMEHFWPKPIYEGPMPEDPRYDAKGDITIGEDERDEAVVVGIMDYAAELKSWKRDADIKVAHLTFDNLIEAFERADIDAEPGLRFWWEYLEFSGFDEAFYNDLVAVKKEKEWDGKGAMASLSIEKVVPKKAESVSSGGKSTKSASRFFEGGKLKATIQAEKASQDHKAGHGGKTKESPKKYAPYIPPHLRYQ